MAKMLLGEAYALLRAPSDSLASDLGKAKGTILSWARDVSSTASGILAAAGFKGLVSSITQVGEAFIKVNDKFEQYRISLGVLMKSEQEAVKMLDKVKQMAATTPFTTSNLMEAVVQLKTFGFATEELLPMLKTIGDAASAAPEGMEQGVHRITYALAQMKSTGRIYAREINMLAFAGVPAWQMLADAMGKTVEQVRHMTKTGELTADQAIPMLLKGMQGRYGGLMAQNQARTFTGLFSNIKDNLTFMAADVGKSFWEVSKSRLSELIAFMDASKFRSMKDGLTGIVNETVRIGNIKLGEAIKWLGSPDAAAKLRMTQHAFGDFFGIIRAGIPVAMRLGTILGEHVIGPLLRAGASGLKSFNGWLGGDQAKWLGDELKNIYSRLRQIASIQFSELKAWAASSQAVSLWANTKSIVTSLGSGFLTILEAVGPLKVAMLSLVEGVVRLGSVSLKNMTKWLKTSEAAAFSRQIAMILDSVRRIALIHLEKWSAWMDSSKASLFAANLRDIVAKVAAFLANNGALIVITSTVWHLTAAVKAMGLAWAFTPIGALTVLLGGLAVAYADAQLAGDGFVEHLYVLADRVLGLGNSVAGYKKILLMDRADKGDSERADEAIKGKRYKQAEAAASEFDKLSKTRSMELSKAISGAGVSTGSRGDLMTQFRKAYSETGQGGTINERRLQALSYLGRVQKEKLGGIDRASTAIGYDFGSMIALAQKAVDAERRAAAIRAGVASGRQADQKGKDATSASQALGHEQATAMGVWIRGNVTPALANATKSGPVRSAITFMQRGLAGSIEQFGKGLKPHATHKNALAQLKAQWDSLSTFGQGLAADFRKNMAHGGDDDEKKGKHHKAASFIAIEDYARHVQSGLNSDPMMAVAKEQVKAVERGNTLAGQVKFAIEAVEKSVSKLGGLFGMAP